MTVVIIIVVALLAIIVIGGLALAPALNKKGDVAIARAKELVGGPDAVRVIEPKAVGMGTEPESAGGLLGLGCLAASTDTIAFVTWQPQAEFTIPRSSITSVDTAAEDPSAVQKTTIELHYNAGGDDVIARWRFGRDLVDWLDELGYDWGPDGRPAAQAADDDADA